MRLKFNTLKKLEQLYKSDDFQIEAKYDKFDGEEYIMFRFGYWAEVDLTKLKEIFNPLGYEVEKQEIEDEDTGWNYSYNIKSITL